MGEGCCGRKDEGKVARTKEGIDQKYQKKIHRTETRARRNTKNLPGKLRRKSEDGITRRRIKL